MRTNGRRRRRAIGTVPLYSKHTTRTRRDDRGIPFIISPDPLAAGSRRFAGLILSPAPGAWDEQMKISSQADGGVVPSRRLSPHPFAPHLSPLPRPPLGVIAVVAHADKQAGRRGVSSNENEASKRVAWWLVPISLVLDLWRFGLYI